MQEQTLDERPVSWIVGCRDEQGDGTRTLYVERRNTRLAEWQGLPNRPRVAIIYTSVASRRFYDRRTVADVLTWFSLKGSVKQLVKRCCRVHGPGESRGESLSRKSRLSGKLYPEELGAPRENAEARMTNCCVRCVHADSKQRKATASSDADSLQDLLVFQPPPTTAFCQTFSAVQQRTSLPSPLAPSEPASPASCHFVSCLHPPHLIRCCRIRSTRADHILVSA